MPSIRARWCGLLAGTLLVLAGCASSPQRVLRGEGLGATWSVTLTGELPSDAASIQHEIERRVAEVSAQLSRWDAQSSLNALNAAADDEWHEVPPLLFEALERALSLAEQTGGAYDPTVAPLLDAWGFGTLGRRFEPPTAQQIETARARVGWSKVKLDPVGRRVRRPQGVVIDLSSMTHGLAADHIARYLQDAGITRYLVDVGGEFRAGAAPAGRPWRIAIERPPGRWDAPRPEGTPPPLRVLQLQDAGIATSGDFRYFFDYNGRRYSHRIDPRTGAPVEDDLASVTVVASDSQQADALATALSVLGPVEGFEFAQRHEIAALFVVRVGDGIEERMTPRFSDYIT